MDVLLGTALPVILGVCALVFWMMSLDDPTAGGTRRRYLAVGLAGATLASAGTAGYLKQHAPRLRGEGMVTEVREARRGTRHYLTIETPSHEVPTLTVWTAIPALRKGAAVRVDWNSFSDSAERIETGGHVFQAPEGTWVFWMLLAPGVGLMLSGTARLVSQWNAAPPDWENQEWS